MAITATVRPILRRLHAYDAKDRLMAVIGPLAMMLLFAMWLVGMVIGFGLILWWSSDTSLTHSLAIAGSSVFTLGIASSPVGGSESIEFVAAAAGLLVIALEIAYLPALYSAFAARETEVTLLVGRSGTPAWGPELLARAHWFRAVPEMTELYATWERWAAGVSESHTNYPALMWFRSPVHSRSWLLAFTAVMDAAALQDALNPGSSPRQARVFLMMGTNCLRSLADTLSVPYDSDPLPTAGLRLTYEEFGEGIDRLEGVGYPMERDRLDAWRNFSGWRVNYESIVDALTLLVMPPPAPWLVDRPEVGAVVWPAVVNRTPDQPEGRPPSQGLARD
jgi:hypothetical protein